MKSFGLVVLLLLAGCAGKSMGWDNISHVKVGMTEAELLTIMGKPYLTKKNGDAETWVWTNPMALTGASVVSFGLKNGRVTEVPNLAAFQ